MEIVVQNFGFGLNTIIEELSLVVDKGQKIAISGANGVGKSTLFDLIIGKYKSDIRIENADDYGYFGKNSNINFDSTLQDQAHLFADEIDHKAYEDLKVGFNFSQLHNKKIKTLSQGNKIKSELIFILSMRKKRIFFLDEPTENLDTESLSFFGRFIKKSEKIFVVISHDSSFLESFATRKFIFKDKTLIRND